MNVSLVGRLGANPELRASTSGASIISVRIAETVRRNGNKTTQWISGVAFGKLGEEVIHKYAKTGDVVFVTGSYEERVYKNKEQKVVSRWELVISGFEIVSSAHKPEQNAIEEAEEELQELNPPE